MDLQALIVFVGGFAFVAIAGYLVTVFGAKEQTYEEALEAQKKNKESKKPAKAKNPDNNKKKNKWKKNNKGENTDKNDADGEEEVVVVESLKEAEPLVVEVTPEPSPPPTPEPKKPKSKKAKKILIEDVEEVAEEPVKVVEAQPVVEEAPVEVEEEVEVPKPVEVAPEPIAKSTPTKTKAKKQKAEAVSVPTIALGSPRDLLTAIKKTSFNDEEAQAVINVLLTKQSGGPLNTSEEWIEQGKPSETKQLKQELNEAFKALEEERNNKIAFEKQLTMMRKDLNEKLVGVKKAAGVEHQRILAELAAQHTHNMNQANARMADMHNTEMSMRARMEEVQMEKMHTVTQYQAQVDNLSHQLQMAQNQPTPTFNDPSLLTELEQLRSIRDRYEGQLNEFLEENKNLKEQVSSIQERWDSDSQRAASSSTELTSALAAAQAEAAAQGAARQALQADLARVTAQLEESKAAAAPADAAATHAAELAALKATLAQKEEEIAAAAKTSNGHAEVEASQAEELTAQLEEAKDNLNRLHMDHEKILAKQKVAQADMEAQLAAYQGDLQTAQAKNNELEGSLASALAAPATLLARLFPSIEECTEEKVCAHLAHLATAPQPAGDLERLEGQVEHYKTVLAQTESMLTSLQSSVESAEAEWRVKLEASTKELAEARGQAEGLVAKVSALEQEVAASGDMGEMQAQLAALQAQLAAQQAEKGDLEARNAELAGRAESLAQEVTLLTSQQEELARGNTGLQAALGVAQEALEKEQGGVRALQEQLAAGKDGVLGNGTTQSDEVSQ